MDDVGLKKSKDGEERDGGRGIRERKGKGEERGEEG